MGIAAKINHFRKWLMYGPRYSSESYIRHMNRLGAQIDSSAYLQTPESIFLDDTNPFLLEIGKNVKIAAGVKILTHDACWHVMMGNDGQIRGHVSPVRIGENVFIGVNSVILCGVDICSNVIISAGSVVGSHLQTPGVYAGNPAKLVASYDDYMAMRESRQVREAYVLATKYYERFGKKPPMDIFKEHFWIFAQRDIRALPPSYIRQLKCCGNYERAVQAFMASSPDFDGFDKFWEYCLKKMEKGK